MQLLLDGHFSQVVSRPLRASGVDAVTLDEWHNAAFRDEPDEVILEAAAHEGRTLVTYDVNSIPALVVQRDVDGLFHAGIIYVSDRTIRQNDFGGLIRALLRLVAERGDEDWTNVTTYLRPA